MGLFVLGLEAGPGSWVEFLGLGCIQGMGPSTGFWVWEWFLNIALSSSPDLDLVLGSRMRVKF